MVFQTLTIKSWAFRVQPQLVQDQPKKKTDYHAWEVAAKQNSFKNDRAISYSVLPVTWHKNSSCGARWQLQGVRPTGCSERWGSGGGWLSGGHHHHTGGRGARASDRETEPEPYRPLPITLRWWLPVFTTLTSLPSLTMFSMQISPKQIFKKRAIKTVLNKSRARPHFVPRQERLILPFLFLKIKTIFFIPFLPVSKQDLVLW